MVEGCLEVGVDSSWRVQDVFVERGRWIGCLSHDGKDLRKQERSYVFREIVFVLEVRERWLP